MKGQNIVVCRSVLMVARKLEQEAEIRGHSGPLDLAEKKINDCQNAGDRPGIKFWRSVWTHLMLVRYAAGPMEIMVLQDDDDYQPTLEGAYG